VLLKVLLGGGDELDGRELEAAVLEAGDNGADETALRMSVRCIRFLSVQLAYLNAIRLDSDETSCVSFFNGVELWCTYVCSDALILAVCRVGMFLGR
jgi:hypothetical protein